MEEVHNLFPRSQAEHQATNSLENVFREIRSFGEGLISISQHPSLIPVYVLGNCNTQIYLGLQHAEDILTASRALFLDRGEEAFLDRLQVGEGIVKIKGRTRPCLVKFPLVPVRRDGVGDDDSLSGGDRNGKAGLDYPALVVAETSMAAGGKGMNNGFNKLFRFITGSNGKKEKIAMTTPVLVDNGNSNSSMAFVMPSKYGLTDLPQPANEAVKLRKLDAARYAVMRFSGSRTESNQAEVSARLLAWVKTKNYETLSTSQFAYYDPPWIPGFLRRNEVLIRVKTD